MSKIEHIKLKNGLNIYYYANSSFNLSTCIVEVGAGSFMEDRGVNNGWSHFLEHMMFKNSKHWNTRDRLNKMSENAVDWNAFTGSEEISISIALIFVMKKDLISISICYLILLSMKMN